MVKRFHPTNLSKRRLKHKHEYIFDSISSIDFHPVECQYFETMKTILKWIGIGFCTLVVGLGVGLSFFGGAMLKSAVNELGPKVMGVPVTLERAFFRPLAGTIKLTNLHVGNPQGFKTPAMFDLGEVVIQLDVKSIFRDTIVINNISVVAPNITYEKSLRGSNFSALTKHLEGETTEKPKAAPAPSNAKKSGKRVVIDSLTVTDPALNVSITAAGGHYIPIKLGKVELKDIGKEQGGVTVADAVKIIFSVITSNIENAIGGAGDLVGSGAKAIDSGAKAVGGAVEGGASSVIKEMDRLLGGHRKPDEQRAK